MTGSGGAAVAAGLLEEAPHEMTGDPWLDGVIWARGAKRSQFAVALKLSEMPVAATTLVDEHAQRAGLKTEFGEQYNSLTRGIDLLLSLSHEKPRFAGLPRFRERVVPATTPTLFLEGYLLTATQILPLYDGWGNPSKDAGIAVINPWRGDTPTADLVAALKRLGVRHAKKHKHMLRVPPEGHEGVAVFDQLREWSVEEEEEMLSLNEGKRPFDDLTDRLFVDKEQESGIPVACSVIDRRAHLKGLLEEAGKRQKNTGHGSRRRPVMIKEEKNDSVARDVYWDYQALLSRHPNRGEGTLPLYIPRGVELERCYDTVIKQAWPYSREHQALYRLADTILDGEAHHYKETVDREELGRFFPSPRPRDSVIAFFVEEVRPGWFEKTEEDRIRLKALAEIHGRFKRSVHDRRVRERINGLALPKILDRLETLSFSPDEPPPGTGILRQCSSCDAKVVLFDDAWCDACGSAMCVGCTPKKGKALCPVHRKTPKGKSKTIPRKRARGAGKKPARDKPSKGTVPAGQGLNVNGSFTKGKEIKVVITKGQCQGLHAKKVLTGKTLTEMVGEALEGYLEGR